MRVRVLGSAAGGGVPQWNCNCANCSDARRRLDVIRPRTQSSIAVSGDGARWALFNASPDLRGQLESFPALHPHGLRGSNVAAVVLTDAELDHTAGLLLLREGGALSLHTTRFVREALEGSGLLNTLAAYADVRWTEILPGVRLELVDSEGAGLGLEAEAFEVPGDAPLYHRSDGRAPKRGQARGEKVGAKPGRAPSEARGQTIGVRVRSARAADATRSGAALVYVPGAAAADASILRGAGSEDVLLWDGTFWTDDELPRLGISTRSARDMGHLPISGPDGSLHAFQDVRIARKAFIHINNTNPILREGSPERAAAEAAGWEVAFDGMELEI